MAESIDKTELLGNLLGRFAETLTEWFKFPIYLSWFIIIYGILVVVFIGMYTMEKFLEYFRMLIFALGALLMVAIIIIASGL